MQGLSFIEYILFKFKHQFPVLTIDDIFKDAHNFIPAILTKIKPIKLFEKYLYLLSKADLLMLLQAGTHGISKLNKPEKVYLNNSNLIYSLSDTRVNTGTLRETFFYNQLSESHNILSSDKGDFFIHQKYTVEVSGKNKTRKQISGIKHAYIAADNKKFAHQNTIPLWLFGFLC